MRLMSAFPYAVYALCAGAIGWWNDIAQPGSPDYTPTPEHHFRALFENDSASGRDRNYTHGTRLDYARLMTGGDAWGLSLTQNIYTPETHTQHRVEGQHPYCGYLALGAAYLKRGVDFGCATELQVGVTGRPSLAEKVQNGLHSMFDMPTWDGWGDQVRSEVTLQLTSRQQWRVGCLERSPVAGWQTDGSVFLRESLGTFNVSGGVGFTYRIGRNLPPSSDLTGNTPSVFGLSVLKEPGYRREAVSYFLSLESSLNYVARDLTVDGGVFRDFQRSCARTPWQPEVRLGACLVYHGVEYYTGVWVRGRTYKTQDENSMLGTFSVTWHW